MLTNFLFIITGLLGFLSLIIILNRYKSNKMMNSYLIIILFLISTRYLLVGINYFYYLKIVDKINVKYTILFTLIIPSLYLYFKNLTIDRKNIFQNEIKHLIIPFVFILIKIAFVEDKNNNSTNFNPIYFVIFSAYCLIYYYLSFNLLNKTIWQKREKKIIKNRHNKLLYNWTLFLFIFFTLFCIRLLVSIYLRVNYNHPITDIRTLWIAAFIWISIFIKILISPEILYGFNVFDDTLKKEKLCNLELDIFWDIEPRKVFNNIQNNQLKEKIDENIIEYISRIEHISLEFELFKNFKFSLSDLAIKLKIPSSHINYIFKYHCKISFSEYKKIIRIRHSIVLIESEYLKKNTFESLAKEVGFASYNPFYTSFKEITGLSPREHINQLIN